MQSIQIACHFPQFVYNLSELEKLLFVLTATAAVVVAYIDWQWIGKVGALHSVKRVCKKKINASGKHTPHDFENSRIENLCWKLHFFFLFIYMHLKRVQRNGVCVWFGVRYSRCQIIFGSAKTAKKEMIRGFFLSFLCSYPVWICKKEKNAQFKWWFAMRNLLWKFVFAIKYTCAHATYIKCHQKIIPNISKSVIVTTVKLNVKNK